MKPVCLFIYLPEVLLVCLASGGQQLGASEEADQFAVQPPTQLDTGLYFVVFLMHHLRFAVMADIFCKDNNNVNNLF